MVSIRIPSAPFTDPDSMTRHMFDPLPYYRWYWGDAQGDRRWQRCSWQVRGALHAIYDEAWKEGGVPNDPVKLAEIIGCSRRELDEMMPSMMTLLYEIEPGVLSNRRLERMRTATDRERTEKSRSGRKGGRAKSNAQIELLSGAKRSPSKRHIAGAEQKQKQEHQQESGAASPLLDSETENEQIVIERWNATADAAGFPRMVSYNATRRRALKARLKEKGWLSHVHAALKFLESSDWHRANPISFDTFIRPGKVDQYFERAQLGPPTNGATSRQGARREVDESIMPELKGGGGLLQEEPYRA